MLIDTHAHLSDPRFRQDLDRVVERAKVAGVGRMICPAGNLEDARKVVELTNKYPAIYGAVGLYPGEGQKRKNWREDLGEIEKLIKNNPKVVGVGEIGLDVCWNERNIKIEREMFEEQLEMALRLKKPAIIHNRQSHQPMAEILKESKSLPRGVMHCFTGDEKFLELVLDKGFFVGFDANITYPANRGLRELVRRVPKERLLLETDSPYLPPQGKRGERNEPANVKIAAQIIADLQGVTLKVLGEQTTENAKKLFEI